MNAADMTVHHAMTSILILEDAITTETDSAEITETTDTMSTERTDVKTAKTTDAIIAGITGVMSTETDVTTIMTCGGDNVNGAAKAAPLLIFQK